MATSSDAEALAHPAVVAVLTALTAQVTALEAQVAARAGDVAALQAENAALRARLEQPPKTPQNSALSPAQGFKPSRAARRPSAAGDAAPKRGPQPGHRGVSRSRLATAAVDAVIICRAEQCGACGHALTAQGGVVVGRRQVVELPPVHPRVSEAQRLRL